MFSDSGAKRDWMCLRNRNLDEIRNRYDGDAPTFDEALEALHKIELAYSIRQARAFCEAALKRIPQATDDPEGFLTWFALNAGKVTLIHRDQRAIQGPQEWMEEGYRAILERKAGRAAKTIDLGIPALTEAILPEPGHLMIIAAETGKGKTATALNIAVNTAVMQSVPTLYLNTEMAAEELALRLYAILANVRATALRTGLTDAAELACVDEIYKLYKPTNALFISDALTWLTVDEIVALTRRYTASEGIKVLIVDYIQRLESSGKEERWQILIEATKRLKSLAQETGTLVILLAQLTEEQRLAGSRGMKNDTDAFLILQESQGGMETHILKVEKSRHAPSGTEIKLALDKRSLRLFDLMPVMREDDVGGVDR
jgi:KaiC/GvpD/RAD55 family RecA-like ATPase